MTTSSLSYNNDFLMVKKTVVDAKPQIAKARCELQKFSSGLFVTGGITGILVSGQFHSSHHNNLDIPLTS